MIIPFGPFEPDRSPFSSTSSNVINCLPIADGWGPMLEPISISDPLPDVCRGAVYVRSSTGNYTIIAMTETGAYLLDTSDYSWTDISGTSAPYNLDLNDKWSFTEFGTKLVIHNISDPPQVYDIEAGGVLTDLGGSPPQAKYSWVSGDFLVFGYLAGTNGDKTIRWSGVNDIETWEIGVKGADEQILPEGNEVQGGFGQQGGFYVINRSAMHYFSFAPSSGYTFTRATINPLQGSIAPHSIVPVGQGKFFYLSEDGFFEGVNRTPIGAERVDRWLLDQIDMTYIQDVQGSADPFEKIVWWRFRTPTGAYNMLGYDWQLDRWCTSDIQVGELVALSTPDVAWDGLDTLYATIDQVNVPFDSRIFLGGRPTMATFKTDNTLAFFSGPNLAATLETGQVQPYQNTRALCNQARVITDASGYSVTDTVYAYHGATGTESSASTVNRAGLCPLRSDGLLHQFTLSINAGAVWTAATSIDASFVESGGL